MMEYLSKYKYESLLDAIILKMAKIKPSDRPEDFQVKYQQMLDFKKWFDRQSYINAENELLRKKYFNIEIQLAETQAELEKKTKELINLKKNIG